MGQSESTPVNTTVKSRGLDDTEQEDAANSNATTKKEAEKPSFYKLDLASMDDELYQNHVPADEWLKTVSAVTDKSGFPPESLNQLKPIDPILEFERINGIALYMAWNIMPFLIPILLLGCLFSTIARWVFCGLALYVGILYTIQRLYFTPHFVKAYKNTPLSPKTMKANQYIYTERNSSKYCSTQFVWPASLQRPALVDKPVIYCVIPHGVIPIGVTPYAVWSKLWNDRLCHFTCAPIVLKIPIVSNFMKLLGYIPAKSTAIAETLTKKEENVGIILDGIEGMFAIGEKEEIAVLNKRKGIVKIALRAGVPIIPVYGFGHTKLYTILQDPFGILKELSIALDTALTPFFGRFGWFLGPPHRVPVTLCLGEPVNCPLISEPTQEDVNKYHKQLLDNFVQVFEQHKSACGYGNKKLKIV